MYKNQNGFVSMIRSNMGIIGVLILIAVVLSFLSPVFLTTSNIMSVLLQISNNMYLALGMTMIIIIGGIDLSVGSIVAMSGTLTVGLIVTNGLPIWLAILLGLLVGTVCGLFNGFIVANFRVPSFIVTLATMNMARGIAYIYSGGRSTRIMDPGFVNIGTGQLFGFFPLPVVYMIILIVIAIILLNKTKFGTYIYAVGGNRESARLSGVPIKKVVIMVYTLSGFLAAFAGLVLCTRMFSSQPAAGSGY
jgi:ribose transport system permease protein